MLYCRVVRPRLAIPARLQSRLALLLLALLVQSLSPSEQAAVALVAALHLRLEVPWVTAEPAAKWLWLLEVVGVLAVVLSWRVVLHPMAMAVISG